MKDVSRLQVLKDKLRSQSPMRPRSEWGVLQGGGSEISLHAGQMIEVLGEGRWGWSARFFRGHFHEHHSARLAWLSAHPLEMLPMGLSQEGVELSRILFLENVAPEQGMEMVLSVLRSHLFQILIFDQALLPRSRQDAQIRKLQLTAEESGAVMLLLSEKPTFSFGVQIRVEADDGHGVRFQKVKGGME